MRLELNDKALEAAEERLLSFYPDCTQHKYEARKILEAYFWTLQMHNPSKGSEDNV